MASSIHSTGTIVAAIAAALIAFITPVLADTIERDYSIGWVTANPDGLYDRPTIGVNGKWPIPLIEATVGDTLKLHVTNDLGNASTSLHFHGIFQNGTNHMDGATGVVQCPIPPGESFTYNFKVSRHLHQSRVNTYKQRSSSNRVHTGTTRTTMDSTPKAFVGP